MKIGNNTNVCSYNMPSFGMAFKPLKENQISAFTNYVTNNHNKPVKIIERGLKKFQKIQRKNQYADILYCDGNMINVVPGQVKSKYWKDVPTILNTKEPFASETDKIRKEKQALMKQFEEQSGFQAFKTLIKIGCKNTSLKIRKRVHPEDRLPANLRRAADCADKQAKRIQELEAADRAAEKAKSEAAKRIRKDEQIIRNSLKTDRR